MRYTISLVAIALLFIIGLATLATSATVDKSIILWLRFDEGKGDVANDSSQYGNNGQINSCKWVAGKYNSGLEFDGTKSFVEVKDNDSLLLTSAGVTGVTIGVWLKTDQKDVVCGITIEKGVNWGPGSYCLNYPGYDTAFNNKVRFQVYPKWSDSKSGTKEVSDNNWHYCAGTYDIANKKYKVYVDGKLETEEAGEANIVAMVGSAYIGARAGNTMFYKGVMDDLLIANAPLSEDMLKKHMNGSLAPVQPVGKLMTVWGNIKSAK